MGKVNKRPQVIRLIDSGVEIVRVIHGTRDVETILDEDFGDL